MESIEGLHPKTHLLSLDEKTGIQALERLQGVAPESKACYRRREFEYTRDGTLSLMAAVEVAKGKIISHQCQPTRNEEDFLCFIQSTLAKYAKDDQVIILADQLNTHQSASLVGWIAQKIDFRDDLGIKGHSGILANINTRKAFLEDPSHPIRFVYTPKHCSWFNPIENWFARLQSHVIRNGNFSSTHELKNKIDSYISFYNRCLIKPLQWTFKGFIKAKELKNLNCQVTSS